MAIEKNSAIQANKSWIPYCVAIAVWGVTVLPSIFMKGWFYFDDPEQLQWAATRGWLASGPGGRHIPVFMFYRKFVYSCVGDSVAGFYLFQSLVVLATLGILLSLVRKAAQAAAFAQIIIGIGILNLSLAAATYTLGKHEPVLALLMAAYLSVAVSYFMTEAKTWRRPEVWIGFLLAMVCVWAKETAMLFPFFLLPALFLPSASGGIKERAKALAPFLIASFSGLIMGKWVIPFLRHAVPSDYTKVAVSGELMARNLSVYAKQTPDLLWTFAIAAGTVAVAWRHLRLSRAFQIAVLLLVLGMAYFLGMLCWTYAESYYLYPPQLLAITSLALVLSESYAFYKQPPKAASVKARRASFVFALAIPTVLIAIVKAQTVLPFIYLTTAHRMQPEVTAQAVEFLTTSREIQDKIHAGKTVHVFFENGNFVSEPPGQVEILLNKNNVGGGALQGRFEVHGYQDAISGNFNPAQAIAWGEAADVTPTSEKGRPVPGDYVLCMEKQFPGKYYARGIAPDHYPRTRFEEEVGVKLSPPIYSFGSEAIVKRMHLRSRCVIYRIVSTQNAGVWSGRMAGDGRAPSRSTFTPIGDFSAPLRVEVCPDATALPNQLTVIVSGKTYKTMDLRSVQAVQVEIPANMLVCGSPVEFNFDKSAPAPGGECSARLRVVRDPPLQVTR